MRWDCRNCITDGAGAQCRIEDRLCLGVRRARPVNAADYSGPTKAGADREGRLKDERSAHEERARTYRIDRVKCAHPEPENQHRRVDPCRLYRTSNRRFQRRRGTFVVHMQ